MSRKITKVPTTKLSSIDSIEQRIRAEAAEKRRQAEMAEAQQEEERKRQRADIINGAKATLNSSDAILQQTGKIQEESKEAMKANDQVADKLNEFKEKADAALVGNLRSFFLTLPGQAFTVQDPAVLLQLQQLYGVPQELSESEIVVRISSCQSICVLVGVDVSYATEMNYEQASRPTAFHSTPKVFWSRQHEWKQQLRACGPNSVHNAVADLVNFFNSTKRSGFVVTQSLDGFRWV